MSLAVKLRCWLFAELLRPRGLLTLLERPSELPMPMPADGREKKAPWVIADLRNVGDCINCNWPAIAAELNLRWPKPSDQVRPPIAMAAAKRCGWGQGHSSAKLGLSP
mmetsp:Transcript_7547/g.14123  ORF Transcript_7547/g.14123 Transcript_7547/m.14123 type:complete len:108 (-) Transcript_7547:22-345(-)